ncbi:MAG: transposase [Steroidobacteraceae bacterium]
MRRRRRHTPAFKAAAIAACREPGASVAAVALERQLNANLLRTWIKKARTRSAIPKTLAVAESPLAPVTFVPLKLESRAESTSTLAERPIRVHIRKGRSRITIEWPATAAGACASWLRELLG